MNIKFDQYAISCIDLWRVTKAIYFIACYDINLRGENYLKYEEIFEQ